MRHTTGLALTLCACAAFTVPTNRAAAWVDAPLCVAQPPQLSEYTPYENASPLQCEPEEPFVYQQGPLWTAPISIDEARRAFKEATALADSSPTDALVKLRLVERALPRIADRLALQRANLLLRLDRQSEACEAFRAVTDSIEPGVAADGRIGLVSCLLDNGDRAGEAELDRLIHRYPALGERAALQVKLARAREGWHNLSGALPLYRSIDLFSPETGAAADARAALARLREQGVAVQPYTPQEWVERGERLVYRGTVEAGRGAVRELLALDSLHGILKGRVHILEARVARMEARWDDVPAAVARAIESGIPTAEAERWLPRSAVETLEPGQGDEKVRRMLAGRPLRKLKVPQQRSVLDLAVHYDMAEVASEVLDSFTAMGPKLAPQMLYDSAVDALGVASPESLHSAFESVRQSQVRSLQLGASYYRARALEGLGRDEEARAAYREVSSFDQGYFRYYGMLSESRLTGLDQLAAGSCERDPRGGCRPDAGLARGLETGGLTFGGKNARLALLPKTELATILANPREAQNKLDERMQLDSSLYVPSAEDRQRETIVARLGALDELHGAAYPWLGRALDLAQLERFEDAGAEINEVYLAYRDARGNGRMRVGSEAVLMNAMQPRHECANNVRRDRMALDGWGRQELADIAELLEAPGIALRLRDIKGEPRPRPFAEAVERAAARFDVDPNLMYAVMRVESVYYQQIVSPVGAVGLMQIMPQTGLRIARQLDMTDFNPRELLDPRRNLEFAAWYLASLIRRFDGRVPLAVAAYNGGPHNVRAWLNARPKSMPLDAFLERIPFRETRGYVRRVMSNYGAYRAQQDLPMANLAMSLPRQRPDTVAF